jgi:hypothetical protein
MCKGFAGFCCSTNVAFIDCGAKKAKLSQTAFVRNV